MTNRDATAQMRILLGKIQLALFTPLIMSIKKKRSATGSDVHEAGRRRMAKQPMPGSTNGRHASSNALGSGHKNLPGEPSEELSSKRAAPKSAVSRTAYEHLTASKESSSEDSPGPSQSQGGRPESVPEELRPAALIGYVVTLGPILLAIVRLVRVSKADPETLLALLRNLDIAALTITTLLPVIPMAIIALSFLAIPRMPERRTFLLFMIIGSLNSELLTSFVPIQVAVPMGMIAGFGGIALQALQGRAKSSVMGWRNTGMAFVVVLTLSLIDQGGMWLPPEIISQKGRADQTVYVLSSEEDVIVVLRRQGGVEIIPRRRITARQFCEDPSLRGKLFVWGGPEIAKEQKQDSSPRCP